MKNYLNRSQVHILLTLAVMIIIFIESAMPGDMSGAQSGFFVRIIVSITGADPDTAGFVIRKLAHFTEYAILGMCIMLNVKDWYDARFDSVESNSLYSLKARHLWSLAWIIGTAYAMSDELHQRFVPGRSGEIRDVCIDAAGVAAGAFVAMILMRRKDSNNNSTIQEA